MTATPSPPVRYCFSSPLLPRVIVLPSLKCAVVETDTQHGGKFGLRVLASEQEYTEIGFHPQHPMGLGQVYVDRRWSSGGLRDVDIRAGPWPTFESDGGIATLHAYIDHSLVTVIINNATSFSVWVHPQSNASVGVALFAEKGGCAKAADISVWQLSDSN